MKTIEQIREIQFKVLQPYLFMPVEVGGLLDSKGGESFHMTTTSYRDEFGEEQRCANYVPIEVIELYPNLFARAWWWEQKTIEELKSVVYVKIVGKIVLNIEKINYED